MKIPATAYVLTLNSAATLPACLESLRDFDDILVLDGNSTDGTREIAERAGARVIPQGDDPTPNRRIENFTEVRERAFEAARHDWIFQLDSDEVALTEVVESVREIVSGDDRMTTARFRRLAVVNGRIVRYAYFYPEWCLRLVHRGSGIAWNPNRAVHERLMIPPDVRVIDRSGEILQSWPSLSECRAKDRRYLTLATRPLMAGDVRIGKITRAAAVNVAKGFYVAEKIAAIHLARKPDTLPLAYHLRFPAYHFSFAARLAMLAARRLTTHYSLSTID